MLVIIIIIIIDGMFGTEADFFLRRLAERLSIKWER